jgi:hypothetical protein
MEEFARLLVGLIALAILISFMRRGPEGVREWARAKFLGHPPARVAAA